MQNIVKMYIIANDNNIFKITLRFENYYNFVFIIAGVIYTYSNSL